jgi:dual specificity tyrosine-phosphorylation-regulated kinase 2/3/4
MDEYIPYVAGRKYTAATAVLEPMAATEPMNAIDAYIQYIGHLTPYEQAEIDKYDGEVYYVGAGTVKIEGEEGAPQNCGFDDEDGRYIALPNGQVAYRYKLLECVGRGAYSDCYRAFDFKGGGEVVIKIIRSGEDFLRQSKIETSLLGELRSHDADDQYNVVHMKDSMVFRGHAVITFEKLGGTLLNDLMVAGVGGLKIPAIRRIARDVLQCLQLLDRLGIVHGDLKPENILHRPAPGGAEKRVKLIDFGNACHKHSNVNTYVQSRFYRSPEIVLGVRYGPPIDIWSLGCVLVELASIRPLFQARNNEDLIILITELLGLPPEDVLSRGEKSWDYFHAAGTPLRRKDSRGTHHTEGGRQLEDVLKDTTYPDFLDFLRRCLTWDPDKRITAAEGLKHPFLLEA